MKIVAEEAIAQLDWKDNSYYLFLTNMDDLYRETEIMRQRPNKSASCAKTACVAFGDLAQKLLPRSTMTYLYNYLMNMVDRGNQRQANYPIQRNQVKSWKAMFCNLVNIIAVNAYLLSLHSGAVKDQKFIDQEHCQFRETLYMGLFKHSIRVNEPVLNTEPEAEHCKIKCK